MLFRSVSQSRYVKKCGEILYRLEKRGAEEIHLSAAHSTKGQETRWELHLTSQNFMQAIPNLKPKTDWEQISETLQDMWLGEYSSQFSEDIKQDRLIVECMEKMAEKLLGKIRLELVRKAKEGFHELIRSLDLKIDPSMNSQEKISVMEGYLQRLPIILQSLCSENQEQILS